MTEQNLTDLLERTAERTLVGPPPLEEMLARARHRRRHRTVLLTAAASAAVLVAVGGTAVLSGAVSDSQQAGPAGASVSPAPTESRSPSPSKGTAMGTSLNGTWTVRALIGSNGQSVLPASYADRMEMTLHNGKMGGTTGCNNVFGVYKQSGEDGQNLVFPRTPLGSTLVGCRDEPPLIASLLQVRHVSGSGSVRYLHADDWMIIAELRRR